MWQYNGLDRRKQMALLIVACSQTKACETKAALELYQARQFSLIMDEFAEWGWAAGHQMVILSAEHGLVPATTSIQYYDRKMSPARTREIGFDPRQKMTAADLMEEFGDDVYVYGGRLYRETAEMLFGHIEGIVGENRGNGDHFSALKDLMEGPL
jgi:hypothetical protein